MLQAEKRLKLREELAILLLGIKDKPIPTPFHLHKELFILSKVVPKLKDILIFDNHYMGAYSLEVEELVVDNLLYYKDAITKHGQQIYLSERGKEYFRQLYEEYSKDKKFVRVISIMKLIRELYDRLSIEEFALLLYDRYPETKVASTLIRDIKGRKHEIIEGLKKKGYITEERYEELLNKVYE
jgi:hypothetical protein